MAAASYGPAPPLISNSAIGMLHQFNQSTRQVGRVNKGDSSTAPTDAWELVDEAGSPRRQVSQSLVDVEHCVGDVMKALAPTFQESAHRRMRGQRTEQLDKGSSDRDHRFLHPLIGHHLPVNWLDSIPIQVAGDGGVEVVDRNPNMIEVVKLH